MKWICFLLFINHVPLIAQDIVFKEPEKITDDQMEVGIEAGPALTTIWGNSFKTHMECHYMAGAYYRYTGGNLIGIQAGIYVEKIGAKIETGFVDGGGNYIGDGYIKYRFDYLTIPILIKINAIRKKFSLNFTVGGFVSYLFDAKNFSMYPPGQGPNPGQEVEESQLQYFERINGGVALGAAVDYSFDFGLKTGFELRDQLGLVHTPFADPTPTFSFRTNSLQFLFRVAYRFK